MGDMTTTPARVHQSGSELERVATKFGGHLLAITVNWTLGSPLRPDGAGRRIEQPCRLGG